MSLLFSLVNLPSLFKTPSMEIFLASSILASSIGIIFPLLLYPLPSMSNILLLGNTIFFAVCSFTVSVPVLSLAITVQLPRLSTAFNFFTMTFFLAILVEPTVRAIVNASGSPSGIADTDKATTLKNIDLSGSPL